MTTLSSAFYSNRLELLYENLKERLFASPADPFARRLIVVSGPAMKSWLMLQLARDPEIGVAAGLEISTPDALLEKMGSVVPLQLELALKIEWELRSRLAERAPIWQPLIRYLHLNAKGELTQKGERRLIALSSQLASLFLQYRKYGRRVVADWQVKGASCWQSALWLKLFSTEETCRQSLSHVQLHLFALNQLSPLHLEWIAQYSAPTYYYMLSPCQAFWTDIRSDRESRRLYAIWRSKGASERQLEELEGYLRDGNPLLANFGRLGREMVEQLEKREIASDEAYFVPPAVAAHPAYEEWMPSPELSSAAPLTLLEAIQADMLTMRPLNHFPPTFDESEDSIQLHAADSLLRETEIVFDLVAGLLTRHAEEAAPLLPEEILVLSPHIEEYAPFIRMVSQQESSPFPIQLFEAESPLHFPVVRGFFTLLALAQGRWSATEVLELFAAPAFQRKQRLTDEDLETLRLWIRKSGITWGESSAQREEILARRHCRLGMVDKSAHGTWDEGLERLMESLVTAPDGIEASQGELLGKFLALLRSLRQDLKPLHDGSLFTLQEWGAYLQCLYEAYLREERPLESEMRDQLMDQLADFKQAGASLPEATFPFATIRHHLESSLLSKSSSYREKDLHAVRFASLGALRAIPAKAILLMGMEEDSFPRRDRSASLNLLKNHPKADYCPSQVDSDRTLFLEALLSARRYLIATYQGFSKEDHKELSPSLLIQELTAYCKRAYGSEITPFKQPFHAFDPSYFQSGAPHPSFSQRAYRAACAFTRREKQPPLHFIPHFTPRPFTSSAATLDLSDLAAFAKNPLKSYFNKTLGLYIPKEEEKGRESEEKFAWSSLDLSLLNKKAQRGESEDLLQLLEPGQQQPLGLFREAALLDAQKKVAKTRDNLKKMGVSPRDIVSFTLSPHCEEATQTESGHWQLPPLQIRSESGAPITLVGTLEEVTPAGLLQFKEKKLKVAVEAWPLFLVYDALVERDRLPFKRELLFVDDCKGALPFWERPDSRLAGYLDYYAQGLASPSPLLPNWVEHLLKFEPQKFKEKVEADLSNSFNPIYNEYLLWLTRHSKEIASDSISIHWKGRAETLFADLMTQWFNKNEL